MTYIMSRPGKRKMVGLPLRVYEQLVTVQQEMNVAREEGRGYQDISLADQGTRGTWIPHWAVIERLIQDFQNKRKRSGWRGKS